MHTFDDLLEYELGDEVVLYKSPLQHPMNNFKTLDKGKIIKFYENGFEIETKNGEIIRTYLPFVCTKEEK